MHISLAAALLLAPLLASADGWPEYRGPRKDGSASSTRLPLDWEEDRNVAWKTAIHGRGWSSPVVFDGRVWLTTATPDGKQLFVLCVDLETGEILHERMLREVEEPLDRNPLNSYASPSPVVEEGRVWVHFGAEGTFCLDTETGETVWSRQDLRCDYLEGPGASPLLHRDRLLITVDGVDVQYVVALDKQSGRTLWKTDRSIDLSRFPPDLRKAYNTPIVIEVEGREQLVSSAARGTWAYDFETGEELWLLEHPGFSMSSRSIFADGLLYLNTGFMRPELWAVRPAPKGAPEVVWKSNKGVPAMASPVLYQNLLIQVSDGGVASCVDAGTGEIHWRERLGGEHCASPILVEGRVYFFDREGHTTVIAPAKEFEILSESQLDAGFMASAAVVGDALLLRTETHLYRVESE